MTWYKYYALLIFKLFWKRDKLNGISIINSALEIINLKNAEINSELIKYRPKQVFTEDFSSNLVDFLLDHRILRSKIKEVGIKHKERDITHNKYLPVDQTDEKIKIYQIVKFHNI